MTVLSLIDRLCILSGPTVLKGGKVLAVEFNFLAMLLKCEVASLSNIYLDGVFLISAIISNCSKL
jgi:hypothetical protein